MVTNREQVRTSPDAVAQSLLEALEDQPSVSRVAEAGFVNGIGHDGIVIGSDLYDDRRTIHVYLEIASQTVIDHNVTKSLLEKLSLLQSDSLDHEVKCLLLYSGSITEKARQDLEGTEVIARSWRSLADLRSTFWQTILPEYRDRGRSHKGQELIQALDDVPTGREYSSQYEDVCGRLLEFLFCPELGRPKSQVYTRNRSQRRDFIMKNGAQDGFWAGARDQYKADYLVVEVKNVKGAVSNSSVWQLAGYMKEKGVGFFGMLIARNGVSRGVANHAIIDQWVHSNKMIVPISNEDLVTMVELRDNGSDPTDLLEELIDAIRCEV